MRIEVSFGIPPHPPESTKMADTMVFFDSGGAGDAKK